MNNLIRLHAVTANLELIVEASQELNLAARQEAGPIAGRYRRSDPPSGLRTNFSAVSTGLLRFPRYACSANIEFSAVASGAGCSFSSRI